MSIYDTRCECCKSLFCHVCKGWLLQGHGTRPSGRFGGPDSQTYQLENAENALSLENDGKTLTVRVAWCPAVKHLRATDRVVSQWFWLSTQTVIQTLSDHVGLTLRIETYDKKQAMQRIASQYHKTMIIWRYCYDFLHRVYPLL